MSASSTGTPSGKKGTSANANAAPTDAARRGPASRGAGSTRASRTTGSAASSPRVLASPTVRPASAPRRVPAFCQALEAGAVIVVALEHT
ncbi:hypothetical protein ACQEVS_25825 [Streptomyces sp. CA-181903]|uniref:hypothetical protein n=1 Tax=Streptomyces sp. CA-181903 TaxID=3240055 RepID=UPI003D8D1243